MAAKPLNNWHESCTAYQTSAFRSPSPGGLLGLEASQKPKSIGERSWHRGLPNPQARGQETDAFRVPERGRTVFFLCSMSEAPWLKKKQIRRYQCWSDRLCDIHSLDAWRGKPLCKDSFITPTNKERKKAKASITSAHPSQSSTEILRNSSCNSPLVVLPSPPTPFQDGRDFQNTATVGIPGSTTATKPLAFVDTKGLRMAV